MVRRHLNYTREEWLALPWDMQRCHLEALAAEDPPKIRLDAGDGELPGEAQQGPPQPDALPIAVESRPGGQVIDLQKMIRELRGEAATG